MYRLSAKLRVLDFQWIARAETAVALVDQIVQEGILQLLLRLQEEFGISYLFITHDIATVKAISDEIVVMYKGKVVEQGLKSEILNPPYPEYTQLLLSSVPEMDPEWLTDLLAARSQWGCSRQTNLLSTFSS